MPSGSQRNAATASGAELEPGDTTQWCAPAQSISAKRAPIIASAAAGSAARTRSLAQRAEQRAQLEPRLARLGRRLRARDDAGAREQARAVRAQQRAAQRDEELAVALQVERADAARVPAALER